MSRVVNNLRDFEIDALQRRMSAVASVFANAQAGKKFPVLVSLKHGEFVLTRGKRGIPT